MPDSVAVLKAHPPLTCTRFHQLSTAAACGRKLALESNPCMAQESKYRPLRPFSHATLRGFVVVFRAVRGFFREAAAVFLALGAALTEDGNSSLGCFAVRWWPWRSGWMRTASSSARS
jgi:hypothetical protein